MKHAPLSKETEQSPRAKKPRQHPSSRTQEAAAASRAHQGPAVAPSATWSDFAVKVHIHKTALPQEVWFVPSHKAVVSLQAVFLGAGQRAFDLTHPALSRFLGLIWKGAGHYDMDEFEQRLYDSGATISFRTGLDNANLLIWAPYETYTEALGLAALALSTPRLPCSEFKRIKEAAKSQFAEALKEPGTLIKEAANAQFYEENHPYRHSLKHLGEDIELISTKDIRSYLKFLGQAKLLIVVSGPEDKETEIVKSVEETFLRFPREGQPLPTFTAKVEPKVVSHHVDFDIPQVMILHRMNTYNNAGYKRPADDPQYFARRLAFAIVAQPTLNSMLFRRIRTELGLAYSCGGTIEENDLDRYMTFFLGTEPRSYLKADEALRALFAKVTKEGISREDFEMTKKEFLGGLVVSLESSFDFVSYVMRRRVQGFSPEQIKTFMRRYNDVTFEEVNALAKTLFDQPLSRVSIGRLPSASISTPQGGAQ